MFLQDNLLNLVILLVFLNLQLIKWLMKHATWSSFSGLLLKYLKIESLFHLIRGTRFFGPSKMSFVNLLKHSLSIIAVFKITLLIRSIFFLIAYLFLVTGKISVLH